MMIIEFYALKIFLRPLAFVNMYDNGSGCERLWTSMAHDLCTLEDIKGNCNLTSQVHP
jgi:hypothetical protein